MRDPETIETALVAAETGHLVFSTLHTLDAPETINRIVSAFPPHQQIQIRQQLRADAARRHLAAPAAPCRRPGPRARRRGADHDAVHPRLHLRPREDVAHPRRHRPGRVAVRHAELRSGDPEARQRRHGHRRRGVELGLERRRIQDEAARHHAPAPAPCSSASPLERERPSSLYRGCPPAASLCGSSAAATTPPLNCARSSSTARRRRTTPTRSSPSSRPKASSTTGAPRRRTSAPPPNLKLRGRGRIARELAARGVDAEVAGEALASLAPDADAEAIARILARKRVPARLDPAERRRIFQHLLRRGFSADAIGRALRDRGDDRRPRGLRLGARGLRAVAPSRKPRAPSLYNREFDDW